MRVSRRARAPLAGVALLALLASPCSSQLSIDAGYRNDRYFGSYAESVTVEGQRLRFRPFRPDLIEIAVHRQTGRVRLGLSYSRGSFGLSADDGESVLEFGSGERLQELALSAAVDVRPGLRIMAGPQVGFWNLLDEPTSTVLGVHAAVELHAHLAGPLSVFSRAGLAYVGQVLSADQLDADQATGTLTRRTLAAGARLGL